MGGAGCSGARGRRLWDTSRRLEAAQLRSWAHVALLCDRAVPKCEPAGKPQLGFAVPVLLFVLCVRTAGTSALAAVKLGAWRCQNYQKEVIALLFSIFTSSLIALYPL